MEKIKNTIIRLMEVMQRNRGTVLALGCMVVFITTYLLILPAFTLEADKAAEQGGIDVPETILEETSAEEDGSAVQEDQTEVGKTEDKQAETAAAGDDSVKEDTKKDQEDKEPAPAEKKTGAEAKAEAETETSSGEALQFEGKGFSVSVDDTSSVLPGNTKLVVDELLENPTEGTKAERKEQQQAYKDYCDQAITAINDESASQNTKKTISFAKLYDISLQSSGDEIAPDKPVNVTISYDQDTSKDLKVDKKADVRIVHFAQDEKTGEVTAELLDKDNVDVTLERSRMTETSFEAESFSVYAVVYTVDLSTYVVSASGDTYEVTVTFDETAGIPADAELSVREISKTEKEYDANVKATNKQLKAQNDPEISDPVQFDISIMSNGEEIEPKEGSVVNVEIKLASEVFGKDDSKAGEEAGDESEAEQGEIWYNGEKISLVEGEGDTNYTVAHITDDGKAEIIDEVKNSIDEDDNVVLTFDTKSFSTYLYDGASGSGYQDLPSIIYVGDEIYMWNQADMWVTNIGTVVSETKHENGWRPNPWANPDSSNYKTVTAISPGYFRIGDRDNWGNFNDSNSKLIEVRPARSGIPHPATIDTVDNASIGLKLNLFDYDLGHYLDDYYNGSGHYDDTCISDFANYGINAGHPLKFWGSGIGNQYGYYNQYVQNGVTSIVQRDLVNNYPYMADTSIPANQRSLSYLFTPSDDGANKKAYTDVNGLFKKVNDYYVYDSNSNYAWYNPNTNTFEVYNGTYNQHEDREAGSTHTPPKAIGFFPFHEWDPEHDLYVNWNKNLNHHFGMSMSVDFSLPKDPKDVLDTDGNPIVFEFSGDDDLWVFIDGKLAMDIGGIHQPTSGTINFRNKTVTVNGQAQTGFDFSNLYDGKKHTLQVFYIERGGCDSNCMIKFNMTQYGDIHFEKVDKDDPSEKLVGAVFGIYKDADCTEPLLERLNEEHNYNSRAYVAESDEDGKVQFSDIPLGTYYLKELHAPEGYPLDNTVHIVNVYVDQTTGEVKVKVTIDGEDVNKVKIPNKKPSPIDLGIKKEWQNADGASIVAPEGVSATFEIKRIRTYETYTEEAIEGQGREVSHLTVGWVHNGQAHVYEEFDLIAESIATVSWGYVNGYEGSKDCILDGNTIDKSHVSGDVISQVVEMPAANGSTTLFIVDDSENGEAITTINVAGQQYYGNSGGGVIHTFETHTEPDPDFRYTGTGVTNNQVTLPIGQSTWQYIFSSLPTFGRGTVPGVDHPVAFNYSYYIEEVSNTAPEGTTVVYKDTNGHVISSSSDAETHTSGDQTVINKVPVGYLRIDKSVTFNGVAPSTPEQKSALAGTYTFKVFTDENCSKPYKVISGAGDSQTQTDLELTITIADDGTAKSSDLVKLPVGEYWIEEQLPLPTGVTPESNRIKVTVTTENTTEEPAIVSFVNNKEESDNPDEMAIELEKQFTGIPDSSKIPPDFQVTLSYTVVPGSTNRVEIPLTGTTAGNVTCTKSDDGLTWHWRITQIPKAATDFKLSESNYDIAGYTRITTINSENVDNPGSPQDVSVLVPAINLLNVTTTDYTTSDRRKVFTVADNQVLFVRMTSHATVIVSQKSLSKSTREALEKLLRDNDYKIPGDDTPHAQWDDTIVYFSHEIQGNSFSYGGRTIYFNGNNVEIPHNASSHEVRADISYTSESAENSFVIKNNYTEVPINVDVIKVEEGDATTKLPNAEFELRQLEDVAPASPGGTCTYKKDDNQEVIVVKERTGDDGKLTFTGLTRGYYEITEKTAPPGYILSGDITFYFKVDGGEVTWIKKGTGKPSTWDNETTMDKVTFSNKTAGNNAAFTVENEPGTELPHTGGIGTAIFYIFGLLLAAGCGALLLRRTRFNR